MKRTFVLLALVVGFGVASLPLAAADLPVVRQPNDPAYSAADRGALSAAWTAVADLLRADFSLPRVAQLRGLIWSDADYAGFVAGTLQAAGYTAYLVTGPFAGASRSWVLAGVALPSGAVGYLPVEAAPSLLTSTSVFGQIAWQNGVPGTSFDPRYLAFTQAQLLPPNMPPATTFTIAGGWVAVDITATFLVMGSDPDGGLLAFIWEFSNGEKIVDTRLTLWYTFKEIGDAWAKLTVVDTRGARTVQTIEIDVLAEKPDCGCGGGK
jgi:hypothetical protein